MIQLKDIFKKCSIVAVLVAGISLNSFAQWTEKGFTKYGTYAVQDRMGSASALSADGQRYMTSATTVGGVGYLRMFEFNDGIMDWQQMGTDIMAEAAGDVWALDADMSDDGTTVIGGAYGNDVGGSNAGHVRVYEWDGATWVQKGSTLTGVATNALFGLSVSINEDGSRIGVCSVGSAVDPFARIYEFVDGDWEQLGDNLPMTGSLLGGSAIQLNAAGDRVVIGSDAATVVAPDAFGSVSVYEWDGVEWNQMGSTLEALEHEKHVGKTVTMNAEGNRIAVRITLFSDPDAGISESRVRIYEWDGTEWVQMGGTIYGTLLPGPVLYGIGLSMNAAGDRIAIGDPKYGFGRVFTFKWNGTFWELLPSGIINSVAFSRDFGYSVGMDASGHALVVGDVLNYAYTDENGATRVYEYPCVAPDLVGLEADSEICVGESVEITITGDLNDADHWAIYSGSCAGDLIGTTTESTFTVTPDETTTYYIVAEGYCAPDAVCESIEISINTVETGITTDGITSIMADSFGDGIAYQWVKCADFSFIDGETDQDFFPLESGDYAVIINDNGCIATSECATVEVCDQPVFNSITAAATTICLGESVDILIDGFLNDATEWVVYSGSCEGTFESSTTDFTVTVSPTETTTYYIRPEGGCIDEVLCLNVEISINSVDAGISVLAGGLMATATGMGITYQWMNCLTNEDLAGETDQDFFYSDNGTYACIINDNGCIDTTACMDVSDAGIEQNQTSGLTVYPNPFSDFTTVNFGSNLIETHTVIIQNLLGEVVYRNEQVTGTILTVNRTGLSNGIYLLTLSETNNSNIIYSLKLIVE